MSMPTYVTLLNWTEQGIRNVRDALDRAKRAKEAAEPYGVRFADTYYTVGPYDIVSVMEAADEESAAAILLALGAAGNVRSTTLRAYDRDEMSAIIERLGPPAGI